MIKRFSLPPRRIALFLWHWLFGGFFLGTLTLTGPVRWTAGCARSAGWGETPEKLLVFGLIAALAAVSLLLAGWLTQRTEAAAGKAAGYGLPAATLALALAALALWMNPKLMTGSGMKASAMNLSRTEFVFGPYPEKDRLAELKAENYTAVISLLSRAVVPFEPVLLARETEAAKEAGIELIHVPMLPWVSSNGHVEAALTELLIRGPGKYYVHCYLGKDRVNVFGRMLTAMDKGARLKSLDPANIRRLTDIKQFERGAITRLGKDVFFTPYPTDEEFFGYVLNGTVSTLVSLLNPANPEDRPWIEKEKGLAARYGLKLVNYPWKTLEKAGRAAAASEIKALEKPMVIHAFLAHTPDSLEFIEIYRKQPGTVSSAAQPASAGK